MHYFASHAIRFPTNSGKNKIIYDGIQRISLVAHQELSSLSTLCVSDRYQQKLSDFIYFVVIKSQMIGQDVENFENDADLFRCCRLYLERLYNKTQKDQKAYEKIFHTLNPLVVITILLHIVSKMQDDLAMSNKDIAGLIGVELDKFNEIEVLILEKMDYNLVCSKDDL